MYSVCEEAIIGEVCKTAIGLSVGQDYVQCRFYLGLGSLLFAKAFFVRVSDNCIISKR